MCPVFYSESRMFGILDRTHQFLWILSLNSNIDHTVMTSDFVTVNVLVSFICKSYILSTQSIVYRTKVFQKRVFLFLKTKSLVTTCGSFGYADGSKSVTVYKRNKPSVLKPRTEY